MQEDSLSLSLGFAGRLPPFPSLRSGISPKWGQKSGIKVFRPSLVAQSPVACRQVSRSPRRRTPVAGFII